MRNYRWWAGGLLVLLLGVAGSCSPFAPPREPSSPWLEPTIPTAPQAPGAGAPPPVPGPAPQERPAAPLLLPLSGGTGWRAVFRDEFSATRLDRSRWTHCYWWNDNGCTNLGNANLQWYTADNIALAEGMLALTAKQQATRGINGRQFPYTSGIVTTGRYFSERSGRDRFAFTYGYVEVRARVPSGQGLWPAIWLLPSTHRALPEIDIMEVLGHRPNVLEMHFHYQDESGHKRTSNHPVSVENLSHDFHTYGLEWSPQAIIWYLDGVEQWRFDDAAAIPKEPMYLLVNLAVGGTWPGAPDQNTQFPAQFLIDYVRIWQREQ